MEQKLSALLDEIGERLAASAHAPEVSDAAAETVNDDTIRALAEAALLAAQEAKRVLLSLPHHDENEIARLDSQISNAQQVQAEVQAVPRGKPVPAGTARRVANCAQAVKNAATETIAEAKDHEAIEVAKGAKKPPKPTMVHVLLNPKHPVVAHVAARREDDDDERPHGHSVMEKVTHARVAFVAAVAGVGHKIERIAKEAPRKLRTAGYHAAQAVNILDDHALDTAQALEQAAANAKTAEEKEYYIQEQKDAVARRVLARTFMGQEVDKIDRSELKSVAPQLGNKFMLGHIGTGDVMKALIANGAFESGYNFLDWGGKKNAEWSDRNVKRIDLDGDGQISDREIIYALKHGKETYDRVKDNAAAKTSLGKLVDHAVRSGELSGNATLKARFDTDHDGKVELNEVVAVLKAKNITDIKDLNHDHQISAAEINAALGGQVKKTAVAAGHSKK